MASKDGAFALVFTRKYLYAGLEHLGFEIMLTWPQVAGLVAAGITIAVVIYIVLVAMGYKPFPAITGKLNFESSQITNFTPQQKLSNSINSSELFTFFGVTLDFRASLLSSRRTTVLTHHLWHLVGLVLRSDAQDLSFVIM